RAAPAPPEPPPTKAASTRDPPLLWDGHACEPIVRCGVWSGCVWLDRIGPGRYRERHGAGVFVRRRECAGTKCAVHCIGADGGAPCFDGLHPENEACDETAMPTANGTACLAGAGICGSLM